MYVKFLFNSIKQPTLYYSKIAQIIKLQTKVKHELHKDKLSPKQWCQCILQDNFMLGGVTLVVIREYIKVSFVSCHLLLVQLISSVLMCLGN